MTKSWVSEQGLWGITKMNKKFGIPESELRRDLPKLEGYARTVPQRRRDIKFAKIIARPKDVGGRPDQFQGDLLDIEPKLAGRKLNKGVRYLCLYIDVYSRKLFGAGIAKKNRQAIMKYSTKLLLEERPHNITYDRESGIRSRFMRDFLDHHEIKLWHPERDQPNSFKGATAIIERATGGNFCNRTIRTLITKWKVTFKNRAWIDSLPALLANYNDTVHGAFKNKRSPNQVYESNNSGEDNRRAVDTYAPSQKVRIRQTRKRFEKASNPSWSRDVYTVDQRAGQKYFVKDSSGQRRKYRVGPQDLQRVSEDAFSIRRSSRRRAVDNPPTGEITYLSLDPIKKPNTIEKYFKPKVPPRVQI